MIPFPLNRKDRSTKNWLPAGVLGGGTFVLLMTTAVFVTLHLPPSYASTARIKVWRETPGRIEQPGAASANSGSDLLTLATEIEIIRTDSLLDRVIRSLDLVAVWGRKSKTATAWGTNECRDILRHNLDLRPVRNPPGIEIRVFSDDGNEAAKIANELAAVYVAYQEAARRELMRSHLRLILEGFKAQGQEFRENDPAMQRWLATPGALRAELAESAKPSSRPIRPNNTRIILGALGLSLLAAALIGGGAAWWPRRKGRPAARTTGVN